MPYKPHQVTASDDLADRIERDGFAALAGAPRSGKTATAIRVCELLHFDSPLVFTPKNAIDGWHSEDGAHRHCYTSHGDELRAGAQSRPR